MAGSATTFQMETNNSILRLGNTQYRINNNGTINADKIYANMITTGNDGTVGGTTTATPGIYLTNYNTVPATWNFRTESGNNAEISNITVTPYNSLVVLGNRSAKGVRKIQMYDDVSIPSGEIAAKSLSAGYSQIQSGLDIVNRGSGVPRTHFDYTDNKNYISGITNFRNGKVKFNEGLCFGDIYTNTETCITEDDLKNLKGSVYTSPIAWGSGLFGVQTSSFSPVPSKGYYQITIKRRDNNAAWRYLGTIGVSDTGFNSVYATLDSSNITLSVLNGVLNINLVNGFSDFFIVQLQRL